MSDELYIQSHAYVLTLDGSGLIASASDNLERVLGRETKSIIGRPASELFRPDTLQAIQASLQPDSLEEILLGPTEPVAWGNRQIIAHAFDGGLLLEVEPYANPIYTFSREAALRRINQRILQAPTAPELLAGVCEDVAEYLLYDRVVVYKVDADGSGSIREEYNNGKFPTLKGMRYRMEDLPGETHDRFGREIVLSYPSPDSAKSQMVGHVGEAETLIRHHLGSREVYPTLERFAKESKVCGIVSIALWHDDKLWGIINGHSRKEVYLDHQLRNFAYVIGSLTSQALANRASNLSHRRLLASESIQTRIRENLAGAANLLEGLQRADPSLVDLIPDTSGVAILLDGELVTIGTTPAVNQISELLSWAGSKVASRDILATDNLAAVYDSKVDLAATASGIMLLPLNSRCTDWIAWFRGERTQKIRFGSRKADSLRSGDRRFEYTEEIRRGFSLPWTKEDLDTAKDLQTYIREVVMERYSHLTRINRRLQIAYEELQSFSYTLSHDLRAPLRGIDGFAEILMEDYGHQIDETGKSLIEVIQQNAARMNGFLSDMQELSRIGRSALSLADLDVTSLVETVVRTVQTQIGQPVNVQIRGPLPPLRGDEQFITMVFRHLIANAVKYSSGSIDPIIEVGYRSSNEFGDGEFYVADNGIGIDKSHHERVFGMFNRLVTNDDYQGNGIGLAIARRIITRHNGNIRVESEAGRGATFLFYTDPIVLEAGKPLL
ncbi:MAG: ATP-binding protein [Lewinella sp.]